MSEQPIESLPPDLKELFAREREGYPEDLAMKAEVLARVEMAVGLSGPGGGGGPAPSTTAPAAHAARKLLAVALSAFALGGGAGVALTSALHPPAPALPLAPPPSPSPPASPSPSPFPTPSAPPSAPASPLASALPPAPHPPSAPSPRADLARERELLDVARAALARSRPDDAIAACRQHAERWPHGALREEREVVLIQALVAAGRKPEAERRAAGFREMFPQSMLLPAVDEALGAAP